MPELIASQVALFRPRVPLLAELLRRRNPAVLEVGSFVGGFLEACRERGWDARGIDPGIQVAQSCRERGLDVFVGDLDEAAATGAVGAVDCVAIWNTFDQLPHPRSIIALVARLLRENGVLALRVPHGLCFRHLHLATRSRIGWERGLAKRTLAWNNLLAFPYLHGHTVRTLDALLGPWGFRRILLRGDVLGRLSGPGTARWARVEEDLVKRLQRRAIDREARDASQDLPSAAWLEIYYGLTSDFHRTVA